MLARHARRAGCNGHGGIVTNGPHTRATPPASSAGSNQIFTVVYTPVPEPAGRLLALLGILRVRRAKRNRTIAS